MILIVWRQLEFAFLCADFGWRIFYLKEKTMNVSFIGGAHFKKDDRNNYLAMLALINNLDFDPANFYFLNDNQFSKLAYRHCKNYKKLIPESKLIYIADPSKKKI